MMRATVREHFEFVSSGDFMRWLLGAAPGERITYFAGSPEVCLAGVRPSVGEAARKAAEKKQVDLTQRRRGDGGFEYIAIRRSGGAQVSG